MYKQKTRGVTLYRHPELVSGSCRSIKGFTLIELLVVVLIIGILSAVAVPQYKKAVEKSRVSEALVMINSISKALDVYLLANGMPKDSAEILKIARNQDEILDIDLKGLTKKIGGYTKCSEHNFCYSFTCAFDCRVKGIKYDGNNKKLYTLVNKKTSESAPWQMACLPTKLGNELGICKSLESNGVLALDCTQIIDEEEGTTACDDWK